MEYKTLKPQDPRIPANFELVTQDGTLREINLGKFKIRSGDYGNTLVLLIESEGVEAKRYRVKATIAGFGEKITYHEDSYDAGIAAAAAEDAGATVKTERVDVLLTKDGIVEVAPSAPEAFDLPF